LRILMTGATGLIGSQLGIALVKSGHDLTVLSRRGNARDLCFPARCLAWDHVSPLPESVLFSSKDQYDAVIHLAGESVAQRWNRTIKQKIHDSRVKSTKALISSFANQKRFPKIWLNASAIGIYGDTGLREIDESQGAASGFLPKVCVDWEKQLEHLPSSTRTATLRFGVVLSNEAGALPQMIQPFIYGLGGPIGNGQEFLSWVHLDDAVAAIIHTLNTESLVGPINIVAPEAATNKTLTHEIAKNVKMPAWFPVPKFLIRLLFGEMSTILLTSAKVTPRKLNESGFKFTYPLISDAIRNLLAYVQPRGTRLFVARQWISGDPTTHFPFFSAAENLETITPPWLNFRIIGKSTANIQEGTLIDYKLRIKGLPVKWRTRIENWDPPHKFVDTQLRGPYRTWHHTHLFEKLGGGTLMTDRVLYRMYFWPFGDVGLPMVKNDVKAIFNYRKQVIEKILGSKSVRS